MGKLKIRYIIGGLLLVVFGALLAYVGWDALQGAFKMRGRYLWVGVGILAYVGIHRLMEKNREWLATFSHELTHTIVALMCLREITSFQVNKRDGVIWSRGFTRLGTFGEEFVSLAPYCLPLFTYAMLLIWSLVADAHTVKNGNLMGIDIIIGMTVAFHVYCFKAQTSRQQPDINKHPLLFSYAFIWVMRLLNLIVLLLCYQPSAKSGEPMKVWGAFWHIAVGMWKAVLLLFSN